MKNDNSTETGKFLINGNEVELPINDGYKLQELQSKTSTIKNQLNRIFGAEKPSGSGDIFDLDDFNVSSEKESILKLLEEIKQAVQARS